VPKVVQRGRQYTKRRATVHDDGLELWEVRPGRVSLATLPKLKDEALDAIRAAGIDPSPYVDAAPHGGGLRDAVINRHERPGDSIEGLAARIYEHAAHAAAYRELGAIDQALNMMAELGALVALFDVYMQVTASKKEAGKRSGKSRGGDASLATTIRDIAARVRSVEPRQLAGVIVTRLASQGIAVSATYVRNVLRKRG
jgi:hypothetical protein